MLATPPEMIGKWHLGHALHLLPTAQGFETYFGVPYSNDMGGIASKEAMLKGVPGLDAAWAEQEVSSNWWNVPLMRNAVIVEQPTDQRLLTRRYTDEAIGFIKRHRAQPFFLYLAHSMPHIPLFVHPSNYATDVAAGLSPRDCRTRCQYRPDCGDPQGARSGERFHCHLHLRQRPLARQETPLRKRPSR